ncbi:MAG: hypothetical protein WBF20_20430 [Trebonia sp.]|uniref:hypothetical protein n=1 Tax=Trebonia sp. TaxID=2767075 RepID=UPI003C76334A
MTISYGSDEAAQRKVLDSAAVLSGQKLPASCGGATPGQGILVIKAWAREAQDIIEFWQSYLSSDRDDPIDLIEISGLKMSLQSLLEGLTRSLFGKDAQLRTVATPAWEGIKKHWILVKLNVDALWEEVVYYRDWMAEIEKRSTQIKDPMAMRRMSRQRRDDTRAIVKRYAGMTENLMPVIKEILEFP